MQGPNLNISRSSKTDFDRIIVWGLNLYFKCSIRTKICIIIMCMRHFLFLTDKTLVIVSVTRLFPVFDRFSLDLIL